jgi:hypothetical protein
MNGMEALISNMMRMNTMGRLWHWMTDTAQHHTTFEQFLTQNETFTDSLVESTLGNDIALDFALVGVKEAIQPAYSLTHALDEIKAYRSQVIEARQSLESSNQMGSDELGTILDDVIELCSKTLYLLKLK